MAEKIDIKETSQYKIIEKISKDFFHSPAMKPIDELSQEQFEQFQEVFMNAVMESYEEGFKRGIKKRNDQIK